MIICRYGNPPTSLAIYRTKGIGSRARARYSISQEIGNPPVFVISRGPEPIDYAHSIAEASEKMHAYAINVAKIEGGEHVKIEYEDCHRVESESQHTAKTRGLESISPKTE